MAVVNSFNPISGKSARILILGSMPGVASLKANQYYAHPRNAFWRIMASLYNFDVDLPYDNRTQILVDSGVAVWDVLHTCFRPGSLDSAIDSASIIPNDFQHFFAKHPDIQTVGFNGATAEKSFKRYVLPSLSKVDFEFVRLPSTSPAHTIPLVNKIELWREGLRV